MASTVAERLAMNLPASPFFVFDKNGNEVAVYSSLADAENHLEAIDVRKNEYEAFDAEGRLLELTVEKTIGFSNLGRESVRIAPAENSPGHAEELRNRLQRFFKAAEGRELAGDAALSELVVAAYNRGTAG